MEVAVDELGVWPHKRARASTASRPSLLVKTTNSKDEWFDELPGLVV